MIVLLKFGEGGGGGGSLHFFIQMLFNLLCATLNCSFLLSDRHMYIGNQGFNFFCFLLSLVNSD